MKRYLTGVFSGLALLMLMAACASKPEAAGVAALEKDVRMEYKIIEHKGSMFDAPTPAMIADANNLAARDFAQKYFPDNYVFVATQTGKDLDGVKSWAQNFNIQTAISKKVQTSVETSFNALETGTKDELGAAMETFARVISQAEFSGLNMENDWWFKRRHLTAEGKEDYIDFFYITIYAINKKLLDKQISALLDGSIEDPNDRAAMDKLQEKLAKDGYGLDGDLKENKEKANA